MKLEMDRGQCLALQELWKAKDEAEESIPCESTDPDAFFLEPGAQRWEIEMARNSCRKCPIRVQCAAYAIEYEDHGIWGALTPNERRIIRAVPKIA